MTTVATATVIGMMTNSSNAALIDVNVMWAFNNPSNIGSFYSESSYTGWLTGINPQSLSISSEISAALQSYLAANGVTFGLLDGVQMI